MGVLLMGQKTRATPFRLVWMLVLNVEPALGVKEATGADLVTIGLKLFGSSHRGSGGAVPAVVGVPEAPV